MDVPYRTVAETTITYMKSLRNIQLKLLASMMYVQHRFSLILCRQFANRMFAKQQYFTIYQIERIEKIKRIERIENKNKGKNYQKLEILQKLVFN